MKRRWLLSFLLPAFAGAALLTSCGSKEPDMEPEEIPSLVKQEFEIRPGMSRDAVEDVLGPPAEIGATKEGNTFAQYKFGYSVRSVTYDAMDTVVAAYPPSWPEGTETDQP